MEALRKVQEGAELDGQWSASGWLNALNAGDARVAALFLQEVGTVELVETDGHYLLITIAAEREVPLADRRSLVEAALTRHKKQQANLAYLEKLTSQYAVQLDTAALRQIAVGTARPEARLVRSNAGDWSAADYQQALVRLGANSEPLPADVSTLGFKVTRAFVVDQILPQEAHKHGLYAELDPRRAKVRQQKLIQALWEREIFAHIQIDPAQVRTFYEANAQRYARSGVVGRELQAQVARDLRDAQAAPYSTATSSNCARNTPRSSRWKKGSWENLSPGADRLPIQSSYKSVREECSMYACQKISILAAAALLVGCGHYLVPGRFQPLEVAQQQTDIQGSSMKILDDGTVTFVQNRLEVSVRPMTDEEINRQYPTQSTNAGGPADELPSNPFTYGNWIDPRTGKAPQRSSIFKITVKNYEYPKVKFDPLTVTVESANGRHYYPWGSYDVEEYFRRFPIAFNGLGKLRFDERSDLYNLTKLPR